jgi:hypothetical protein
MLFTGMPRTGWRDHVYTSLAELADPEKALLRWARSAT